jgi:hypothetical protein
VAAAVGAEWAWNPESRDPQQRRLLRLAAVLFLAGTVSTGFHNWWSVL